MAILGAVAAGIAAISILAAQADTSALAVTCAANVSNNIVTWTATPSGGNAPYTLLWSGDSSVAGSTSTSMSVTYSMNGAYHAMIQVTDASSTVVTSTCAATVTSNTTPTVTPPLPRVNQPALSIGVNGSFLARGMTVTSVASGSFQGTVWGITYTVNWSGNVPPEFFFRKGNKATSTTNPVDQLAVGDEVGVSGSVSTSNPLVVNTNVVRDYSITTASLPGLRRGQPSSPFYNGQGNGGGNGNGNGEGENAGVSASATVDAQSHINDLINQLHNLQDLFKGGNH